ncbi:MAG: UbiA prenyltransferase family protein [Candidatus Limnocylindrus sp.]|jgi:4-hydroxybenzoate polyprenyltransferase
MNRLWRTPLALLRLAHPLPTLLNAVAAAALATVAGAGPSAAGLVALTMLGVHTCIGASNDYLDRHRDRGRPEKPIASGALPPSAGLLLSAVGITVGLVAAAQVSTLTFALAVTGALVGATYNVWLKHTALSWLPFALGVSIIPAFAWSTVSSVLPTPILTLSLISLPGGAALALQNSLADRALDLQSGMRSAAVRLGERTAFGLLALLHLVTLTALLAFAPGNTSPATLAVAALLLAIGVACSATRSRWARQRGWEISAAALAVAALSVALATAEGVG